MSDFTRHIYERAVLLGSTVANRVANKEYNVLYFHKHFDVFYVMETNVIDCEVSASFPCSFKYFDDNWINSSDIYAPTLSLKIINALLCVTAHTLTLCLLKFATTRETLPARYSSKFSP
ncbi:hypothetical protein RF11_05741 [Thelohanellus kitauei]|uniref:Uncharacterized protein n=1 Tax=Thelohanellus kitauei TaxID=669202 RepID=A0A0C2N3N2_THEKT|nr:hypothetical protein RF11_05741 [Thelohanellus kitauei]